MRNIAINSRQVERKRRSVVVRARAWRPNLEGLVAQGFAALFVTGSYLVVERKKRPRR
jgi:hypothetical protein